MFIKSQRLSSSYLIQKTIQKGGFIKSPFFVLRYFHNKNYWNTQSPGNSILPTQQSIARHKVKITVVVSTKLDKRAVIRNRIKRIFREAIKNVMYNMQNEIIRWYLVFFPNPNTLWMKSKDLEYPIKNVFMKVK